VRLCWLLGTSVRKTSRFLRRDMPRSQHTFPPFGRVPPRSDLATSDWKAHCRLVLAVHEEDGSRVTRCGNTWCPGQWETTPLLPGVPVKCLGQPTIGPAFRLLPSLVQVLPVVGPPSCARLVVCRGDQQRTVDHRPPFPAPADSAQGRGKERLMGLWGPHASANSLAARTASGLCRRNRTCPVTLLAVHAASAHEA